MEPSRDTLFPSGCVAKAPALAVNFTEVDRARCVCVRVVFQSVLQVLMMRLASINLTKARSCGHSSCSHLMNDSTRSFCSACRVRCSVMRRLALEVQRRAAVSAVPLWLSTDTGEGRSATTAALWRAESVGVGGLNRM